jgi:hypothetical protein
MRKKNTEILNGIEEDFLKMPYNKTVLLRLEFMIICEDELEALILRLIEYAIEGLRTHWLTTVKSLAEQGKPIPEEPQWWVSLSYSAIITRLYGAIKNKKTAIAKITALMNKQLILRRQDPNNPYGSPQYTIDRELLQKKLDELPALATLKNAAKHQVDPIPATGTPSDDENDEEETPIPVDGTPPTSSYHSPIPVGGTGEYQLLVPDNNSNNLDNLEDKNIVDVAPQIDAPLVFHPFHSFIALDDAITPKTIIVYLTSQEYESEIEDDRRSFIAQDVKAELARRGHHVEYRWEREKESVFVDTPSQQNTVEQSTPDVQPTPSQPEQPAPEQQAISVSYSPHDDASQPTLLDVPLGPPTMPPDSAKWNAETMVQIVEVKLGKRFSEVVRGKMSRRERQLNAAERIFKAFKKTTFTRDDFTRAYDERNDAWWRSTKGDLTVEHMAANTTNRVMRTIEVLESLEAKAGKIIQFPGQSQQTPTIPAPAADASPKTLEEVMAELKKVRFELQAMGFSNSQEYRDLKARCMTLDSKRMALLSAQKQAALAK